MNILIFGVSNVGKSTVSKILAKKLGYRHLDLDEVIQTKLNIKQEKFVHTGTLTQRDQFRCEILLSLLDSKRNQVIAVTPLSYMHEIIPRISEADICAIELTDSPENIFNRLVFSDENDTVYHDDSYKNAHKEYYMREIQEDLKWYENVNRCLKNHFDIAGRTAEETAVALIETFHLK